MYIKNIYIYYIHITWSGVIEHGNIGQDLRKKKNKDFTMDSTIRTIQDHGDLTVGYRRYIFWVFSLTVGIKSWNGRTNTKQLNFTIWKDPESKIQSDLIAQNKYLIGKQTTNLPGFAVNEPFIPSLVHIKDFTTGDISMEFTSTSPTWHHGSWDYKVIWP